MDNTPSESFAIIYVFLALSLSTGDSLVLRFRSRLSLLDQLGQWTADAI
jgi:hypothetical protein